MKETLKDIGAYAGLILIIGFAGVVFAIYQKNKSTRKY
jgi:hypothetical protein